MAEELKIVEPKTGIEAPNALNDSISPDTSLTPEPSQDLSAFSLSGISGISGDDLRQAGEETVRYFVMGQKKTPGFEGRSELLQREYGVSEVALGVETFLNNPRFSPELQQAFVQNPDFLFPYSPLRNFEVIKVRLGESITPSHPELKVIRAGAEEYIPEQLPGNVRKHHLSSLGNATEGNVASAIAEDVQSVGALATSQGGPKGIVGGDIANSWEDLKAAARAAA